MCNFNSLDEESKLHAHQQLKTCADAFGGINFFLQLLEAIRETKPHPLVAKHCKFECSVGTLKWKKAIFNDKLSLLLKIRVNESKTGNLLPNKQDKSYKEVMNLLRTLGPIEFSATPLKRENGEGFTLHAFDRVDDNTTLLNPLFDALFFCSVATVKKVLLYKAP